MSEQTPGNMSEREPSMEDILASIRKIIAEDAPAQAGGLAEASALDVTDGVKAIAPAAAALSGKIPAIDPEPFDLTNFNDEIDEGSTQDMLDMVEFDLTDDLAMGDEAMDLSKATDITAIDAAALAPVSGASEDVLELTDIAGGDIDISSDDLDVDSLLADMDMDADLTADASVTELGLDQIDLTDTPDIAEPAQVDDDLDSLLDELVSDAEPVAEIEADVLDAVPDAETVIDPAADLLADDSGDDILDELGFDDLSDMESDSLAGSAVSEDDDIDLVKSLMADLTGENDEDYVLESDDLVDALIEDQDDDLAGLTATSDELTDTDDLSSIIADLNADAQDAEARAQTIRDGDLSADSMQDAIEPVAVEDAGAAGLAALATAAGAGIAAVGAAGLSNTDSDNIDEMFDTDEDLEALLDDNENIDLELIELDEIDTADGQVVSPEPIESDTKDINEKQESDMSATTGREAISSRDTVDDTSSAFASLGKVVEEKAVFQESGPRIGDLVQDALKPMLQEWLDANLKQIVDRAVAKEIKRISSGK